MVKANEAGVQIGASTGCPACDAGEGCGAGIFARLLRRKPVILQVQNTIDAHPGQAVTVGIPEELFLRILFRLYLLPLLSALAGAAAGNYLANVWQTSAGLADGITFLGAALAFGSALFLSRSGNAELPCHLEIKMFGARLEPSAHNDCQSDRAKAEYSKSARADN